MSNNKPLLPTKEQEPEGYRWTDDQVLSELPAPASIKGKVFIVTGINAGIGEESARVLSAHSATVVMGSRNQKAAEASKKRILARHPRASLKWIYLDLSDLESVREFAKKFQELGLGLNGLICNAGIMACPYETTKQGNEMQFGVHHLGHFLLIQLLIGDLIKTGSDARVVTVSLGHRWGGVRFDDIGFQSGEKYDPFEAYGQSKTANIFTANALNEIYSKDGVEFFSVHPGHIPTDLDKKMSNKSKADMAKIIVQNPVARMMVPAFVNIYSVLRPIIGPMKPSWMKTIEQGAATQIYAATSPNLKGKGGAYLEDCHLDTPLTEQAQDANGENSR
ncbi:WW domain-containing oxidoreductase-like protein [Umbelopsis sp. PMI_123]|nr:WW domain-containing oxidoreductase-like protein [Umbelopsis sp. PMI_123]